MFYSKALHFYRTRISIYVCHNVCTNWQLLLTTPLNLCIDKAAFWLQQNLRGHLKHKYCGLWMLVKTAKCIGSMSKRPSANTTVQVKTSQWSASAQFWVFHHWLQSLRDLCTCFKWLDIVPVLLLEYDTSTLHVTLAFLPSGQGWR